MDKGHKQQSIATLEMESISAVYKVVDFLNKNLKDRNLLFGLYKKDDKMYVTIYET